MYVVNRGERWTGYYRKAGKRLSAGTWNTKTEAEYHAMQAERSGSDGASRAFMTLSTYFDSWLPVADLMPITRKGYQSIFQTYILPIMGRKKVTSISRKDVIQLLQALQLQGVQPATLAQVKASLGSAFRHLVQTGEILSNPTQGVKVKIRHADLQHVLEPEDFLSIVKHLPNKNTQLFARFLVASGCRFGEATELRVKDINFKSGEVFIQRRVSDLGTSHTSRFLVVDATKSGYKRSIMLSKTLIQEIQGYVIAKAIPKDELLFSRSLILEQSKLEASRGNKSKRPFAKDGKTFQHGTLYAYTHGCCRCGECRGAVRKHRHKAKPYQKRDVIKKSSHLPRDVWRTIWNKAIAKSDIDWSPRTHDLRHANATHLLKSGVDVHEVKERLGHQSIKTTERYLHRLRHNQSKASESVNDFLE